MNEGIGGVDPEIVSISQNLEKQPLSAYQALERKGEFEPLAAYNFAVEQADNTVLRAQEAFSQIEGIELVPKVAKENMTQAADTLLEAYYTCQQQGKAVVKLFGRYLTFRSPAEVEAALENIGSELTDALEPNSDFLSTGLPIIDKYLFDSAPEKRDEREARILILDQNYVSEVRGDLEDQGIVPGTERQPTFTAKLQAEGLLGPLVEPHEYYDFYDDPFADGNVAVAPLDYLNRLQGDHFFHKGQILPDVVIVELSQAHSFQDNHEGLQQLFIDYWGNLKPNERPSIILYTNNFDPPLYEKSSYEGFLFASDLDQLRTVIPLAKEIVYTRRGGNAIEATVLASRQEAQYDNSFDLREWEHITADTYQSLDHILKAFAKRAEPKDEESHVGEDTPPDPNDVYALMQRERKKEIERYMRQRKGKVRTVLDLGTGDGRIAGMLARLGFNVVGLDISQEQLNRGEQRLKEEGEGLRGEHERAGLSYHTLRKLDDESKLPARPLLDDQTTQRHYVTVKGDFDNMLSDINELLTNWDELHPGIDKYAFFNVEPWNEYAFQNPYNQFHDVAFDAAMFNWHTFCEISSADKQQEALRAAMDMLNPGGLLILELPDRGVDPYASLVKEYHDSHPESPYGTRQDVYKNGEGEAEEFTPRYFPGRSEIVARLQAAGFEINPEEDVQTYLITTDDKETGKKRLNAKELFIVAHKPWA